MVKVPRGGNRGWGDPVWGDGSAILAFGELAMWSLGDPVRTWGVACHLIIEHHQVVVGNDPWVRGRR